MFGINPKLKNHVKILKYVKEKNYKIGILSNFDHAETAYKNLDRFNIINYFNKIIISEEIGYRKPNKITFEIALKELNSTAIDTIFVGDNYNCDILGASECSIDSIWLKTDVNINYHSEIPKFIIDDLSYIEKIL